MAPGRKGRPSGPTSNRAPQTTLAFGRSNKITKPSLPQPPKKPVQSSSDKDVKDVTKLVEEKAATKEQDGPQEESQPAENVKDVDPTLAEGQKAALALRQSEKKQETMEELDADEEWAKKISDTAVRKYWTLRTNERKSPRVHQQRMDTYDKILQHFDLSSQYGPCIGIPRVRRWKRAKGLGMEPPIEVLAVLMKKKEKEDVRGGDKVQKAFSVLG